jgi:hypothetical protein
MRPIGVLIVIKQRLVASGGNQRGCQVTIGQSSGELVANSTKLCQIGCKDGPCMLVRHFVCEFDLGTNLQLVPPLSL